jgi:hypothetical protein
LSNSGTYNVHNIDIKMDFKMVSQFFTPFPTFPRGEGVAKYFPLGGKRKGVQNKKEEFNFLQLNVQFI